MNTFNLEIFDLLYLLPNPKLKQALPIIHRREVLINLHRNNTYEYRNGVNLDFSFAFPKTGKNEVMILAKLVDLETFVAGDANGRFKQHWKDNSLINDGTFLISLPNEQFREHVNNGIEEIAILVNADVARWNEEASRINSINEEDRDNYGESSQETFETQLDDPDESCKDSESSEESWNPIESEKSEESAGDVNKKSKEVRENACKGRNHRNEREGKKVKTNTKRRKIDLEFDEEDLKSKGGKSEKKIAGTRKKFSCPLPGCKTDNIVHLPRHMREVHKWSKLAARYVVSRYNMRKRKPASEKKTKDYHKRRKCPLDGCNSIVLRLSKAYSNVMESAVYVPDLKHPMVRWKEEGGHPREERYKKKTTAEFQVNESSSDESSETPDSSDHFKNKNDGVSDKLACQSSTETNKPCESKDMMQNDIADISDATAKRVVTLFEDWMRSPDGGKRDEKTVKQHSAQLRSILRIVDKDESIISLLDLSLIRSVFLNCYVKEKNYEAGTIKSYLLSLRHFMSFLLSDRPADVDFSTDEVTSAKEKLRFWSKSFKREASTRRWMKLEDDFGNLLTPHNIQEFEKSEAAREAVKLLGSYSDHDDSMPPVTQANYILVRDYLFAQIFIDNANRPGVLSFMTLEEFENMRKEGEDFIISVKKHKTVHAHGPAYIVLNRKLKAWLSIFVNVMRPVVTISKNGPIFLSWNGQSMESGQINKAVQSIFKKAEIEVKITSTSFRKAAVTNVHQKHPELSGKLAGLMAHNEITAKKYYLLTEKSKDSVEASRNLGRLMRETKKEVSVEAGSLEESQDLKEVEAKKTRTAWGEDELRKVKEIFSEEIKKKDVKLDEVRKRVIDNAQLHGMSPRRIYNRLKAEIKPHQESTSDIGGDNEYVSELPAEEESMIDRVQRMETIVTEDQTTAGESSIGVVEPSERCSRDMFSDSDLDALKNLFTDMIVNNAKTSKVTIENVCNQSSEGKKLLSKMGVSRLINRIKYERRKLRINAGEKS